MSSVTSNANYFSYDKDVNFKPFAKFNQNSFAELPTELQYTILELIGGVGTQVSILDMFPDLQNIVMRRKVMKAYYFLAGAPEGSPAKIAFNIAEKKMFSDENIRSNYFEKITNLALKNLLDMLNNSEREEVEDLHGLYSLSLEKIIQAQQILLDNSLLIFWRVVCLKLNILQIENYPKNSNVTAIRSWLSANRDKLHNIREINHCFRLSIIPLEIVYFDGLVKLDMRKGEIVDCSVLRNLTNLESLNLHNNKIEDLTPLENLSKLKYLNIEQNLIKDITPLKKLIQLKELFLSYNQISDIDVIKNFKEMEFLTLIKNPLKEISALSFLHHITILDLSISQLKFTYIYNQIKKLNLSSEIRIYGNPFTCECILTLDD